MKKFRKSSGIILKYGDEVLLCKRSPEESLPNVWSIPAGGMENGESPGQTAIREFHEETNIKVDTNIDLVGMLLMMVQHFLNPHNNLQLKFHYQD